MELDVLSAGDLGQDTDCSDTETSYMSATGAIWKWMHRQNSQLEYIAARKKKRQMK